MREERTGYQTSYEDRSGYGADDSGSPLTIAKMREIMRQMDAAVMRDLSVHAAWAGPHVAEAPVTAGPRHRRAISLTEEI